MGADLGDWWESWRILASGGRLPAWLKVLDTFFVGALIPVYWRHYGPANFLWFSDIALFVSLAALWLESPLLASMQAVAVTLLELAWLVDFLGRLLFGARLIKLADYMFQPEIPPPLRALSLFHCWMPFLLLWLVYRLGYDARAWWMQTLLAWAVLLVCYFLTRPEVNVNWVFGPGGRPQTWLPPKLYLALLMLFFPLCVYLPMHLLLKALMPGRVR
jgi:hypothetical protein